MRALCASTSAPLSHTRSPARSAASRAAATRSIPDPRNTVDPSMRYRTNISSSLFEFGAVEHRGTWGLVGLDGPGCRCASRRDATQGSPTQSLVRVPLPPRLQASSLVTSLAVEAVVALHMTTRLDLVLSLGCGFLRAMAFGGRSLSTSRTMRIRSTHQRGYERTTESLRHAKSREDEDHSTSSASRAFELCRRRHRPADRETSSARPQSRRRAQAPSLRDSTSFKDTKRYAPMNHDTPPPAATV